MISRLSPLVSRPVSAFTLRKPEAVKVTRGADNLGSYDKTPNSFRKWRRTGGGHVFTEHPGIGLTDVHAAIIKDFPYRPGRHVHYQEAMLRVRNGLPKMNAVPTEMGGSAATLPE